MSGSSIVACLCVNSEIVGGERRLNEMLFPREAVAVTGRVLQVPARGRSRRVLRLVDGAFSIMAVMGVMCTVMSSDLATIESSGSSLDVREPQLLLRMLRTNYMW